MRKYAHFVLLFLVAACTLSLSATTVDRPQASAAVATAPDFGSFAAGDTFDIERPSTTPDLSGYQADRLTVVSLDRPHYKSQLLNSKPNTLVGRPSQTPDVSFETGGSSGFTFVNLDRPHYNLRSQDPKAPAPTPEPGSLALLASGLLSGLYFVRRRK